MNIPSFILACMLIAACIPSSADPGVDHIGDLRHRIVHAVQAWGALGVDTCAHASGQTPLKLRIKDRDYDRGLGHHASGEIVVDLEGLYDRFEAEVGVQWQQGTTGSVVFQVFVDDEKRFDSGVMREADAARPVSVSLDGAAELRLVALDAGDGITCDCANWAVARLIRAANPKSVERRLADVAPFARVVTFDPRRTDGSRANRVQEFHADDLFLDTPLKPQADRTYSAPVTDGLACIGLQWLERRCLREAGIEFAEGAAVPPAERVRLEAWVGESVWQGSWRPVEGTIEWQGRALSLKIGRVSSPEISAGTWKVRWIIPAGAEPIAVRKLTAFIGAQWRTVAVRFESEGAKPGQTAFLSVYNGEGKAGHDTGTVVWRMSRPLTLSVSCLQPRSWMADRTVIRMQLPAGAIGIAVDDLLENESVYVRESGVFATINPSRSAFADYRKRIEGRKTVLEQVREMPDQTFEQAMAKTRNPVQDNGPTMLSLPCDNHKFVVEQDGSIRFAHPGTESNPAGGDLREMTCLMRPTFGTKGAGRTERSMYEGGGWAPEQEMLFSDGQLNYQQICSVAPYEDIYDSVGDWPYVNGKPVLIAEFSMFNETADEVDASVRLDFIADTTTNKSAEPRTVDGRTLVYSGDRLLAIVDHGPQEVRVEGGAVILAGKLAAMTPSNWTVYFPGWAMDEKGAAEFAGCKPADVYAGAYWQNTLEQGMEVTIPDPLLQDVIRASQIHCLIAARNEEEGRRIAPWIASDRYGPLESEANSIIRGMMLMGHQDFARKSLDFFLERFSPQGFLTTGYTLMGTGWNLQTLGEYFDLTQDKEWMKTVAPKVERACKWVAAQRAKTMVKGRPEYGLMPPGVQADWNAFACHFALNGYYCAGLREASEALRAVGVPSASGLLNDAAAFRSDIADAFERTRSIAPVVPLRDGTWVPPYPGQLHCPGPTGRFFPGEDGNRSWCYDVELGAHHLVPQGVLPPDDRRVEPMLDHMEDVQFLADGWFDYPAEKNRADWFHLGGFSKVQPYYTRNAEIYALRDDVKPFIRSYFNALASLLSTENLSLWEHFHNAGAWNKTHETGYFLQQTAWMLVQARGEELWLAPFVTDRWLEDGKAIEIRNALTPFGRCGYRIESRVARGFIEATIDPPAERAPRSIALRIRHPEGKTPKRVTVNGRPGGEFAAGESAVVIPGSAKGPISLRLEY